MRSAGLIKYDIARTEKDIKDLPPSLWPKNAAANLERWRKQLPIAERRYLKQLAKVLNFKNDVYSKKFGRLFVYGDARFTVTEDGILLYGDNPTDPNDLTDGNGRMITIDSMF